MSTGPACTEPAGLAGAVAAYCRDHDLLPAAGPVAVAFSGGPDSTALLHVLAQLLPGRVHAVHVDHGIVPESPGIAASAVAIAARMGVHAEVRTVDVDDAHVRRSGLEAAARAARYAALADATVSLGADVCALGHTADDRAETVLMNLMRGAGLDGLTAMRVRRGRFVRPLLATRRAAVIGYCESAGLEPLTDPTNDDPAILRNRVRAELVEVLERLRPGAVGRIAAAAARLEADADLLDGFAAGAVAACTTAGPGHVAFDVDLLAELPPAVAARVVRSQLAPLLGGNAPPAAATEAVRTGRGGQLPGTRLWSRRDGRDLVVRRHGADRGAVALPSRGVAEVLGYRVDVRACPPGVALSVRHLAAGDRIAGAGRTLRDLLARRGVPRRMRDDALTVLADGDVAGVVAPAAPGSGAASIWSGTEGIEIVLVWPDVDRDEVDADGTGDGTHGR